VAPVVRGGVVDDRARGDRPPRTIDLADPVTSIPPCLRVHAW
jgi:hypothetical protein